MVTIEPRSNIVALRIVIIQLSQIIIGNVLLLPSSMIVFMLEEMYNTGESEEKWN